MTAERGSDAGRVVWHDLVTADIPRAMQFYTELFGWSLSNQTYGEFALPRIESSGSQHAGFLPLQEYGGELPHWLAYVLVDDIEDVTRRAAENGGQVLVRPTEAGAFGCFSVIGDPQGATISLITEFVPEHPAGLFLWDELMTTRIDAAERFYDALFGWRSIEDHIGPSGTYRFFQRGPDNVAGLMAKPEYLAMPQWTTYLSVEDVDTAARRVVELDGALAVDPTDIVDIGRFAVAVDPTGAVFGIYKAFA